VSDTSSSSTADRNIYDPVSQPHLFEAVLSKRLVGFFIDAVIIVTLMIPAMIVVSVLGVLTLGLGFFLLPPLFTIVALGYVAVTLGGRRSATIGMRIAGVEVRTRTGQKIFPLLAILHALLFWFSIGILTPLILIVGLFTERKQLLHDLLLGVVVINAVSGGRLEN
jgi:uncharacterized RDD family membrane protein YckC